MSPTEGSTSGGLPTPDLRLLGGSPTGTQWMSGAGDNDPV